MDTPVARTPTHSPSGSRESWAKRHSADHTDTFSSSRQRPFTSPGAHRHSSAILSSPIGPFVGYADEDTEEADRTSLEADEAALRTPTESSPDQTPRGSPQQAESGTPQRAQKHHTRLMSCDVPTDGSADRRSEHRPAVIKTMHPPDHFDIAPFKPLFLTANILQRKGVALTLDYIPAETKYDKLYKTKERDPWQEDLAKLLEDSQIKSWKSLLRVCKAQPVEESVKLPTHHRHQRGRTHRSRKEGDASLPNTESSSEDANDSGETEAHSPSRAGPTRRPSKTVDSDAFNTMYEQYSNFYKEKRSSRKAPHLTLPDPPKPKPKPPPPPPEVRVDEVPIVALGRPSLRGRVMTSFIPSSRNYTVPPNAGSSTSLLSSELTLSEEPSRPDTPASTSDTDYVADLSCPETPRKARRQSRSIAKGTLAAVSDYGEDLQSSSPRSSFDHLALTLTKSAGSGSTGVGGAAGVPDPGVGNTPSADREGVHSHSQSVSKSRKHTSVLPFGLKSSRRDRDRDRDQKTESKQAESASTSTFTPTSPPASAPAPAPALAPAPAPPRQRQIALPPMGAAWMQSVMINGPPPSPPKRPRKSTASSGKTTMSGSAASGLGSSKTGSSKEKEKEKEGGRSRRRMLPRLGLGGGGGGRNSLDREREKEEDPFRGNDQEGGDRERGGDLAGIREGDAPGDTVSLDSRNQSVGREPDGGGSRAALCCSPTHDHSHDHDHYLTDSTPRCSSTLTDGASATSSGVSIDESGRGSDGEGDGEDRQHLLYLGGMGT